nr:MAG TPA: hypothetical protein [Caudoviricetes sp.]
MPVSLRGLVRAFFEKREPFLFVSLKFSQKQAKI